MKKISSLALAIIFSWALLSANLLTTPSPVQAGGGSNDVVGELREELNLGGLSTQFGAFSDVGTAIGTIVNIILFGSAIAAFIYILWGAFRYVTAGDDSDKTAKARTTITNAVVGLILVALSFVIWQIVLNLTGLGDVVLMTAGNNVAD